MKILVITPPEEMDHEVETIHELFERGLEILHLRKPYYDSIRMESLLRCIESKYHSRIMVHSHYKLSKTYSLRGLHFPASIRSKSKKDLGQGLSSSCHSIEELDECESHFEYLLVSPVFDSISKTGYFSGIDTDDLGKFISWSGKSVVALGGVSDETLRLLPPNCWGAAVLGYIWDNKDMKDRLQNYEILREIAEAL